MSTHVIDLDALEDAVQQSLFGGGMRTGFCTKCGAETDIYEPDVSDAECPDCGEHALCGAETLLARGYLDD